MTEARIKKNLLIATSSYATHKNNEVSLDEWLDIQDLKRNDPVFKKRYLHLKGRL